MFRFALILIFSLIALPLQAAATDTPPASYRLGIFPYMAPRQTVDFFGPVAADMEAGLKHPVKLESVATFDDFTHKIKAKSYDIALIQPFDYPEVVEKLGYLPLAQFAGPLVTQIFVRDDSKYHNIADLRGTTIAMPPAQSANARMALRALYDNNLIPGRDVEVRYFNSHDSCIQQVWAGTASACGTAKPPILVFEQRMQARLRAIHDAPPIPHIMFVAHPRVPAADRARLQQIITGWSQTDEGRALLKSLGFPGFVAPKPAEYAMMHNYEPSSKATKATSAHAKDLVLGVFPFLGSRQIAQNFAPTVPALGKAAGTPVFLRTASNFDNFGSAITAANYDIVIVQPFDYNRAVAHGYQPLAGMKNWLQGTFFVLDKSPYKQIGDFKGQVVAMPPPEAAQSRLGRHALIKAGLKPEHDVTIDYRNTHDSCLQQVQRGAAAACVTSEITLAMLPKELSLGLRAVGQTEKVPGVLIMAHERLPEAMREQLQAEIISWKDSGEGRKILRSMGFGDFLSIKPADYRHMPRLD